ncbi:hypothetical protein BV20DRAFT_964982 [Pilatotrama ljubarskyi]|nr:hypothetical protein BV20DRAFT_964982 [Pilatotrama ljubarskyi]
MVPDNWNFPTPESLTRLFVSNLNAYVTIVAFNSSTSALFPVLFYGVHAVADRRRSRAWNPQTFASTPVIVTKVLCRILA